MGCGGEVHAVFDVCTFNAHAPKLNPTCTWPTVLKSIVLLGSVKESQAFAFRSGTDVRQDSQPQLARQANMLV